MLSNFFPTIFPPKDDSINIASRAIPLSRTSSIGPENQLDEGSCFAYTAARIITRCITQIIPNKFTLTSDESALLYNSKKDVNVNTYSNCFVNNSTDLESIREVLSFNNKCSISKRYNHMIIFYYTLFTIKKKYGCEGGHAYQVLLDFAKSPKPFYYLEPNNLTCSSEAPGEYIFSKEIDDVATVLIQEYIEFLCTNQISVDTKVELFNLDDNINPEKNWIKNFPEGAKRALENKMYISFGFSMPVNQWDTISEKNILDVNQVTFNKCIMPITGHAVVVTKWEPNYITILNSWGTGWGNRGYIRLPSKNFYKFVMTPACKEAYHRNPVTYSMLSMQFVYLTFEKKETGEPYNLNTIPERGGGKIKKQKHKKTQKYKSKKNKSKKSQSK
jgi:hypothetical protein